MRQAPNPRRTGQAERLDFLVHWHRTSMEGSQHAGLGRRWHGDIRRNPSPHRPMQLGSIAGARRIVGVRLGSTVAESNCEEPMSSPSSGNDGSRIDDLLRRVQVGELVVGRPNDRGLYTPESQPQERSGPPAVIPRRRPRTGPSETDPSEPPDPPGQARSWVDPHGENAPPHGGGPSGQQSVGESMLLARQPPDLFQPPRDSHLVRQPHQVRDTLPHEDHLAVTEHGPARGPGRPTASAAAPELASSQPFRFVEIPVAESDPEITIGVALATQIIQRLLGSAPHARKLAASVGSDSNPAGLEKLTGAHKLATAAVRSVLHLRSTSPDLLAAILAEDPHADHRARLCRDLQRWPVLAQGVLALRALADWDVPSIVEATRLSESNIREITRVWFPRDSESIGLLGDLAHWTDGDARRFDAFGAEQPLSHLDDVHALTSR